MNRNVQSGLRRRMAQDVWLTAQTLLAMCCLAGVVPSMAEAAKSAKASGTDGAMTLTPASDVNQEASTFQLSGYRENGQKKWEVNGDTANILEDTVQMTNIVAHAYEPHSTVTLTADHGTLHRATQDVHLQDHVVAITDDGAKMRTHELDWHQKEEKVTTPAEVWVQRGNIEVTGWGAVAHPNLKQVQLEKRITVVMTPKEAEADAAGGKNKKTKPGLDPLAALGPAPSGGTANAKTTITCSGPLDVDYEQNVAVFHDDVHVVDSRGQIDADLLTVDIDPTTKQIKRAIAQHHVRIVRADNIAYCDQAVYDPVAGKVTLLGSPRLVVRSPEAGGDGLALPPAAGTSLHDAGEAADASPAGASSAPAVAETSRATP